MKIQVKKLLRRTRKCLKVSKTYQVVVTFVAFLVYVEPVQHLKHFVSPYQMHSMSLQRELFVLEKRILNVDISIVGYRFIFRFSTDLHQKFMNNNKGNRTLDAFIKYLVVTIFGHKNLENNTVRESVRKANVIKYSEL